MDDKHMQHCHLLQYVRMLPAPYGLCGPTEAQEMTMTTALAAQNRKSRRRTYQKAKGVATR